MFDCDTHALGELDQSIVVGVNLYDQATYKLKKSNITSPPHGELDSSMLELLKSWSIASMIIRWLGATILR